MPGCEAEVARAFPDIFYIGRIITKNYFIMLKFFFVWHNKVLKKINPEDVICLYTERNYTKIFLENDTYYLVRATLSGALKKLPHDMFIKINRSFVASIDHIDGIDKDHLLVGDTPIPIAKQYYKSLINKLNIIE